MTPDEKYKIAEKIVDAIIADLTDRSGLDNEWSNIDKEIRLEIREAWIGETLVFL